MSDGQWLKAMAKHNEDRTNWSNFKGGARELSHVLHEQAKVNPQRFALLALKLTPEFNAAFADGLLMGFADAERSDDAAPLIYDAVRHLASLGHDDVDRWLGHALRRYYRGVPIDLVELLLSVPSIPQTLRMIHRSLLVMAMTVGAPPICTATP